MLSIAILVVISLYCQVILHRDKKRFKELQQIQATIKKEEKRRLREDKLKNKRVPGVIYLSDYRPIPRRSIV